VPLWSCGEPYRDGWRIVEFRCFGPLRWQPMPWYFRTLKSWFGLLRDSGYQIVAMDEPAPPGTGQPLSLLLAATP
jgi:hypothetical protein